MGDFCSNAIETSVSLRSVDIPERVPEDEPARSRCSEMHLAKTIIYRVAKIFCLPALECYWSRAESILSFWLVSAKANNFSCRQKLLTPFTQMVVVSM